MNVPVLSGARAKGWIPTHRTVMALVDGLVILWAMTGALLLRFGSTVDGEPIASTDSSYIGVTLLVSFVWWAMVGLWGSRDSTVVGYGSEEYKRILSASIWLFGLIAVISYVFQLETARGYVALALPAGIVSLLLGRVTMRRLLHTQRREGKACSDVLLIGGKQGVEHLARALRSQPMAGYRPSAAYIPGTDRTATVEASLDLPTIGHEPSVSSIVAAAIQMDCDAVALSSGVPLPPRVIRELGWALAEQQVRMILAPALTDIAGPRIHTQPVAGLPLIHVSTPNLAYGQRLLKRTFDVAGATLLTLLISPLLLIIAVIVRLDSSGPVLFRQERVGTNGQPFTMYKFRSMVVDAESQLEELKKASEGNGVLFKIRADPRITPAGKFLRRYSLDELPQLFNVLGGSMSLVGPRPPLPDEVAQYQSHVHRRLMVRPGLTGLWQVSGRSLLSWDDSVRLDLYYVENWSLLGDIVILLKTFRAVLGRHGAY